MADMLQSIVDTLIQCVVSKLDSSLCAGSAEKIVVGMTSLVGQRVFKPRDCTESRGITKSKEVQSWLLQTRP